MRITLKYLSQFDCFQGMRLLAGGEGMDRVVSGCDILDYELDRSLNGKYSYSNLSADRLVLTSFQLAKDDPHLIDEAVKHLISAGASGLVIKNVYRLPLHDYTLRYADAKKFPILLLENKKTFFEDIILQVDRCASYEEYAALSEAKLARLLCEPLETAEKERITALLFPAFYHAYDIVFLQSAEPVQKRVAQDFFDFCGKWVSETESGAVLPYRNGIFLFRSGDTLPAFSVEGVMLDGYAVGISNTHHYPDEIDRALNEAVNAATAHAMRRNEGAPYLRYADIGIYRALLPLRKSETLTDYSRMVLEPLMVFDAENRAELLETVLELVRCGGDLHILAEKRGEHENTLRNRLDKVRHLTGLNYRKPSQYEELALAARILMLERTEHHFSIL